jgi:hypothetical protein
MKTLPVCLKCGKALEKLSERPAPSDLSAPAFNMIEDVICVYRCECGTLFSRTEQKVESDKLEPSQTI